MLVLSCRGSFHVWYLDELVLRGTHFTGNTKQRRSLINKRKGEGEFKNLLQIIHKTFCLVYHQFIVLFLY